MFQSVGLYNRELYVVRASVIPEGNLKPVFEAQTGKKQVIVKTTPHMLLIRTLKKAVEARRNDFDAAVILRAATFVSLIFLTEDLPLGG